MEGAWFWKAPIDIPEQARDRKRGLQGKYRHPVCNYDWTIVTVAETLVQAGYMATYALTFPSVHNEVAYVSVLFFILVPEENKYCVHQEG